MYDYRVYFGHIVQGNLRAAVDYIKGFRSQWRRYKRCMDIFENRKPIRHSKNPVLNEVCTIFDEYYRRVFWLGEDVNSGEKYLCDSFTELLNLAPDGLDWEELEEQVKALVEAQGYHYLGGRTQGYYGPYIWKTTKRKTYTVQLPHTSDQYSVNMLTGFISSSWMRYISLGRAGTGGWADKDGTLCCIKKHYLRSMLTSRFKVDLLKHEAQHAVDRRHDPDMPATHLEYKAKLVQLIYATSLKTFWGFLSEADNKNPENSHSYASYMLIRNITTMVLDIPVADNYKLFKGKLKKIRAAALKLYDDYPKGTEPTENKV